MTEELLLSNKKKDINANGETFSTFDISLNLNLNDNVYETLKYSRPKSCYKRPLLKVLLKLYTNHYLIIILSFLIGFIFLGVPMIFLYFKIMENNAFPLLITFSFGLVISLLYIIIPCIDSKRYRYMISAKVERNNILKNFGNIFLFILLLISNIFVVIFYNEVLINKENKIRFDYDEMSNTYNSYELSSDFIFKFILYILLLDNEKIEKIKNIKIKIIYDNWDFNSLRIEFMYICLPLLIIAFLTLIKIFLIDVRQTLEKVILTGGIFILLFFQCFIDGTAIENLKEKKLHISSLFQNVVIVIILFGYIFWTINYTLVKFKKRRDKNFAIRKYKNYYLYIILLIDLITCAGYVIIVISILYCYISFRYKEESFYYLNISFIIIKIGFIPAMFGNCFYFGYYFLAIIFRPIASEFAPSELKNKCYIKSKRTLWNFMISKKRKMINKMKLDRALSEDSCHSSENND